MKVLQKEIKLIFSDNSVKALWEVQLLINGKKIKLGDCYVASEINGDGANGNTKSFYSAISPEKYLMELVEQGIKKTLSLSDEELEKLK